MRKAAALLSVLPLSLVSLGSLGPLAGCKGSAFTYDGASIPDNFPLDIDRWWDFTKCDLDETGETVGGEPWTFYGQDGCPDTSTLRVIKDPDTRQQGRIDIVTLRYSLVEGTGDDMVETPLYDIDWSSSTEGVKIHSWIDATTGETVAFDPPVMFGENQMNAGDSVSTTSAGITFTSTFVEELGDCPNNYNTAFGECLHMSITTNGGSAPFVGDWWIGATFGPTAFKPSTDEAVWVLDGACASEECNDPI